MKIKFLDLSFIAHRAASLVLILLLVFIFQFCKQSDPPPATPVTPVGNLQFSGISWRVKSSGVGKMGPGPNYFSDSTKNVYVDNQGYLHLKITKEEIGRAHV